jgi:two-component system, chemotaxis family, chemotaxis protein CheY
MTRIARHQDPNPDMLAHTQGYLLLVDDEPDACTAYRMILEAEGYRVVCARGGFEALCKLRTESGRPLLVILDLGMPGIDGMEFRRMKAKDPALADLPIVVVSARTGAGSASGDVKAHLSKPVDVPALIAAVRTWAAPD